MANPKRGDYVALKGNNTFSLHYYTEQEFMPIARVLHSNRRRNIRQFILLLTEKKTGYTFEIKVDKKEFVKYYNIMDRQTANILYGENK